MQKKSPDLNRGLLTPHYEILSERDIDFYKREDPHPELKKDKADSGDMYYWVCALTEKVKIYYHDFGASQYEHNGENLILIDFGDTKYEYVGRRAWPIEAILEWHRERKNLVKNTSHVCISGEYVKSEKNAEGIKTNLFVFDKIKTKSGCISWFLGHCDNPIDE